MDVITIIQLVGLVIFVLVIIATALGIIEWKW